MPDQRDEEERDPDTFDQEDPDYDPKTDADYVALVTRKTDEWYQARKPYEIVWNECLALFIGLHYHKWNKLEQALTEGKAPSYRVRMVINKCMGLVHTYLGKFMRGDPQQRCKPGDPSDTAFFDARVGDKVLRGLWRLLDGREVQREFLTWMMVAGHAYWKVGWDPTMGNTVEFPGYEPMTTGEVDWSAMGPLRILVPPDSPPLYKPSELIDVTLRRIPWIRQVYGDRARGVQADADLSMASSYESRWGQLASPAVAAGGYISGSSGNAPVNMGVLKEYWTDPQLLSAPQRRQFPNGRIVTVCGDKLLLKENSPFSRTKRHPFVEGRAIYIPGRYYGMSILEQVAAPQKAYNRGRSQVIEARNLTANPVLDVEMNHQIADISNAPGGIQERRIGSAAPQWRQPPAMSPHLVEDVMQAARDFDDVGQTRQATKGDAPASNITGVALELLQEADNNPLTPIALGIVGSLSRIGTKTICVTQDLYTEDRTLEVTGENQETEVLVYRADRHQSQLRVDVGLDSVIPQSKASKVNKVETATRLGYLDPVNNRATGLQMLEFGNDEQLYEQADLDRQKQTRETMRMMQGQPQMVADYDDHVQHLDTLNRFRKTVTYETLPPEIQLLIDQHALEHQNALATLAFQAQQQAMGSQPAPMAASRPEDTPAVAGGLGALTGGGEV